jgi:hypothetical protein
MDGASSQPVVITREEALARSLKRYLTGEPCKRGHLSERSVFNDNCLECERLRYREQYARRMGRSVRSPRTDVGPNPPKRAPFWPDDGGVRRVATVNEITGHTAKAGWVNCLGRSATDGPHRFLSDDVSKNRICGRCKSNDD